MILLLRSEKCSRAFVENRGKPADQSCTGSTEPVSIGTEYERVDLRAMSFMSTQTRRSFLSNVTTALAGTASS